MLIISRKLRNKLFYLCWCEEWHVKGDWHDPTHGQVDRDIQDKVNEEYPDTDKNVKHAIMLTLQTKREASK